MCNKVLFDVVEEFLIEGKVVSITPLGEGFINDTYFVETEGDNPNYILQRKNHLVFNNVPAMMDNIYNVSSHISKRVPDPKRNALTVIFTKDELPYYVSQDGNYWAMTLFIENTITYQSAKTCELAYKGGVGIGRFQTLMQDFTSPLAETIKGFHNIRWRFKQWDASLAKDSVARVAGVKEEIEWIESRRDEMLDFWSMVEDGTIPTRVTHNDTKISNILFDKESNDVLCVIDLDTVMKSTSLNDFGDAIRTYANSGKEDDLDLDKVKIDLEMFESYAKGYLSERIESLTKIEIEYLAFSARYITYEQVLRFLMDYIDGDVYYKTKYASHNLDRTRAQYRLLQSMESNYVTMQQIINNIVKSYNKQNKK